jgi:hypothetical protein
VRYGHNLHVRSKAITVTVHRSVSCEVRIYLRVRSKAITVTVHRSVSCEVRTYLRVRSEAISVTGRGGL